MKRLMGILMILLLLLTSFCGCNSAKVNSEINSEDKIVTSTTTTVSGGGTQNKKDDGKGNVSTVISSDGTSTTKAPDKIINKYDKIGDLDLDYVKKIKADYRGNQDINLDEIILTYCATLSDGSVALYINQTNTGHPDVMVEDYIANKYFYNYSSGKGMLIYKDGKFFSIKLAYENGKITKEVLDEIFQKYPQLNSTSKYITADDYLGGLDIKAVIKAKEAYFAELYHFGKTEYSAIKSCKDIKITNCGMLSDGTVLIKFDLKKPISNPINMIDEVGNYKYEYKLGYDVRIVVQGKKYNSVKYAYQKNQISSKIVDEFFAKLPEVK